MFKFIKKKENKNKGFTLVELVIVVAILAILVGILAPQYTKYVEKSRKTADLHNLDNVVNAIKVAVSDGEYKLGSSNKSKSRYIIVIGTVHTDSSTTADGLFIQKAECDADDQITDAIAEYTGLKFTKTISQDNLEWHENDTNKVKSMKWGSVIFPEHILWFQDGVGALVELDNATGAVNVTYSDNVINYLDHGTVD